LFEDLKRQWKESISPDYVLIDSRTGHSDVEGICTRQLPDAVSLLFFPNEQNMSGLGRVTGSIRSYLERNPQRQITLHYAVSNVPDLDDEDHILDAILEKCKTQLGYEELAAEIHHYNSLSLLDQEIFSLSRPNSRLTREYKKLASAISRQNLEDRNAVVELLKKLRSDFSLITFDNDPDELRTKIETILQNFPQDGEICFLVALVHNQLGNIDDALSLLSTASVEEGYRTAHMFAVRARLHHRIGKEKDAERDLIQMLQSPNADFETFMDAISLAEQMCPELFSLLPDSVALTSLVPHEQLFVASQCDSGKIQISTKIAILNRLQQETLEEEFKDSVRHLLAMSYIALGNFSESLNIFETFNTAPPNKRISDIFNFAMAKWGLEGAPSLEVFERIREIDNRSISSAHGDPNYSQCLALTNAILGHTEKAQQYLNYARTAIAERPRREFSAWSYQRELPPEFLKHLDIIETILSGERPLPQFMHQNRLHLDTTK
jgi:tetratricopeptide (TPR) repeat protein